MVSSHRLKFLNSLPLSFQKLKIFLNEAKQEYIDITTHGREKERIINEQTEELLDKQETIDDLEAELAHINICLTEETKAVDILEEKLENQNKKMLDYENKVQNMQEQINKMENEKLLLLDEFELFRKTVDTAKTTKQDLEYKDNVCNYLRIRYGVQVYCKCKYLCCRNIRTLKMKIKIFLLEQIHLLILK